METKENSFQQQTGDCCFDDIDDMPSLEEILDETVAENEKLRSQIAALTADDTKAQLLREQARYEQLSKHAEAVGVRCREAERKNAYLRKFAVLAFRLQEVLGVDTDNILDEVKRLKGAM